jgi:hypothetical protein
MLTSRKTAYLKGKLFFVRCITTGIFGRKGVEDKKEKPQDLMKNATNQL